MIRITSLRGIRQRISPTITRQVRRSFSTGRRTTKEKSNFLFQLLAWYSNKLDTHPLLTKCITSGMIAGTGDFLCQSVIEKPHKEKNDSKSFLEVWDQPRTLRFAFLGSTVVAPAIHYWFGALARMLPGTSVMEIAKRVFLDQFIFTPVFLPIWMSSLWSLEGFSMEKIPGRLMDHLPGVLVANWVVWIPAQGINFRFVPFKYQVLFSNALGLLWNAYLSYSTSGKGEKELEKEEVDAIIHTVDLQIAAESHM